MDKSLPFEKIQPQWQLLYLFLRVCVKLKILHQWSMLVVKSCI